MQITKVLVFILLLGFWQCASYSQQFSSEFDGDFKKWSGYYLPDQDYKLFKSQCIAESNLNPLAVSPVGAKGLCQNMDATWKESSTALNLFGSPFNASLNIQLSAYYMMRQNRIWRSPRPVNDRVSLAMASYNAGAGNIIKAQRKCNNKRLYKDIIPCLKDVTGRHSKETIAYVKRIWSFYIILLLGL